MKILIAGHGELPEALLGSARMIGGELANVTSLGLFPGDTPQSLRERMVLRLEESPVDVILTDLAGGTPDNVANLVVKNGAFPSVRYIIAGVSLPMLLELALSPSSIDVTDAATVIEDSAAEVRFTATPAGA